jgi:hypothetical protein
VVSLAAQLALQVVHLVAWVPLKTSNLLAAVCSVASSSNSKSLVVFSAAQQALLVAASSGRAIIPSRMPDPPFSETKASSNSRPVTACSADLNLHHNNRSPFLEV